MLLLLFVCVCLHFGRGVSMRMRWLCALMCLYYYDLISVQPLHACTHTHTYEHGPFEHRPCLCNSQLLISPLPRLFFAYFPPFLLRAAVIFYHIHLRQINTFSFRLVCVVAIATTTPAVTAVAVHNLFIHIFIIILFHLLFVFSQDTYTLGCWELFSLSFCTSLCVTLSSKFIRASVDTRFGFVVSFCVLTLLFFLSLVWLFTVNFIFRAHCWKLFFMVCA